MDMGEGYAKSVGGHALQVTVCIDNFRVVALATKAGRGLPRAPERATPDRQARRRQIVEDSRWSLLGNPGDLTERQLDALTAPQLVDGKGPCAWAMKDMGRAIFTQASPPTPSPN